MIVLWIILGVIGGLFALLGLIALIAHPFSIYKNKPEEQNPMEGERVVFVEDENDKENADGVKGHLEAVGDSQPVKKIYSFFKRFLDIVISFFALVILSPILLGISIAVFVSDPGPVVFTQKRMGKNKRYFKLHKFRSMKMCTPHDVPTHMLENPEQYITKVGKFIRAHSLDELAQIWDIFIGNMSIIGPRPGLWNQDVLTAERDKYGANDICMSTAYVLIIPFIKLYTSNVTDINYIYQWLPLLFCLVQLLSWSRYVSGNLFGLSGRIRQAVWVNVTEAAINVVLSLVLVNFFSITGVLLATVLALPLKVIYCNYVGDKIILQRKCFKTASILLVNYPLSITFSRVVNGGGIVDLLVTTPDGNVFKNAEVASLTAKAELWRGSSIDTTNVTYKWAKQDSSVTSSSSPGYDADFGVGWYKLSDTTGKYTGTATATITIYAAAVDSFAVFKCCATDTDSSSSTYNSKFYDVASFIDNSDPLQVVVTSTGGDVFKNGTGSTTLTAVVYQAGVEIDSTGTGTYTWTKYNKDGAIDTSWGTSGKKTGKTLSVGTSDVTTKATFMVEVVIS